MGTYADQSKKKNSPAADHNASFVQKKSKAEARFTDARPEVAAQRKLLENISDSQQVKQLKTYQTMADHYTAKTVQRTEKPNHTGLPNQLKANIESLSGMSMDHVKVHYNSDKPAQLQAHAYAQGSEIHVASGQEKHVPHEAWHVIQQAQGRVKPTLQMKGSIPVNDNAGLEKEADIMGQMANTMRPAAHTHLQKPAGTGSNIQRKAVQVAALSVKRTPVPNGAAVQLFPIANTVLKREHDQIYIVNITFHERTPTSEEGGKGDHTVADTLILHSIKALTGTTVHEFLSMLQQMVYENLTGTEKAQHTDRTFEKRTTVTPEGLIGLINNGLKDVDDLNAANHLGEILSIYWRLLEKRTDTAFDRKRGNTTGGTEGEGEAKAIAALEVINMHIQGISLDHWYTLHGEVEPVAEQVAALMDIVIGKFTEKQILFLCERAATHAGQMLNVGNTDWRNKVAAAVFGRLTGHKIGPRRMMEEYPTD